MVDIVHFSLQIRDKTAFWPLHHRNKFPAIFTEVVQDRGGSVNQQRSRLIFPLPHWNPTFPSLSVTNNTIKAMAKTSEPTSKFGPFLSFLGGSVALGIMAAGIATPGVAVADIIASDAVNLASSVSAELPLITLQSRSTIYAKQGDDWVSIANFYNKNRIPVTCLLYTSPSPRDRG